MRAVDRDNHIEESDGPATTLVKELFPELKKKMMVSLKGNQGTTLGLNRRLVLNQLRRNGPMSRSAITAAIGLSPAGVTFVTAKLI